MLHIITWRWGGKYGPEYVERLARGVERNLKQEYRFLVCRPLEADLHLTELPGCFCRLRMFDPLWQVAVGIEPGDRIVCLDLDLIVTGPLDELFDRPESFVILQGANSSNPCPFNGSAMMLRARNHASIWRMFSVEAAQKVRFHEFPDDQGWIWYRMPDAAGWKVGKESGIYAFHKPGWPGSDQLPKEARIVAFPGKRDPSHFTHLPWVREHWLA